MRNNISYQKKIDRVYLAVNESIFEKSYYGRIVRFLKYKENSVKEASVSYYRFFFYWKGSDI